MQSTKKAPFRKEEGTMVAGDDGASIAQPGGLTTTQPVRLDTLLYEVPFSVVLILCFFSVYLP